MCSVIDIDFTTQGAINIKACVYPWKLLQSPYENEKALFNLGHLITMQFWQPLSCFNAQHN